ncbi:MAG: reverse transcriptase-like protein [Deltaproteobacteria bacterium]|nr:reverse transcriptase-like protein [Deltaproteobacteria bacterium]NIS78527.1 reverse transcriptase-like protein [Deltaproteobacteria bacterium]
MKYFLYIDGASRGNPGKSGAGYVVKNVKGEEVGSGSRYIGIQTNNYAEYTALLHGLELSCEIGIRDVEILSDSQLLVRQLQGEYKVRSPNIDPLYRRALKLLENFNSATIVHIDRERNREADQLANLAIDRADDTS